LWAIWIWLSSLTPSSITVSAKAPRSDGGIGADFDVIADHDTANLRNFDPLPGFVGETEAIGPDHRTRMDDAARPDLAGVMQGGTGVEMGVVTDLGVVADEAAGVDTGAGTDDGTGFDHHQRADHRIRRDLGRWIDHGAGMDAGRRAHFGLSLKQLGRAGEIGVRIAGDDAGTGIALHLGVVRLGQDQRRRLGLVGLRTELGIGKESDVAGTGGIQRRDAIDRDGRITLQLTAQALDQLLQSNTHLGFSEW
jgi:hypothetical protein